MSTTTESGFNGPAAQRLERITTGAEPEVVGPLLADALHDRRRLECDDWAEDAHDGVLAAARVMAPLTAADGFPTRAEIVSRYAARTGFDVSDVEWYQGFSLFKLAVVCQGIAARAAGGAMLGSGFEDAQRLVAPLVDAGRQLLGVR